MYDLDNLFKVIRFLKDNPKSDIVEKFKNQADLNTDRTLATTNSLIFSDDSIEKSDLITSQKALNAKETTSGYFENVLHQLPFETKDYGKLETFIKDWYSALKTHLDMIRQTTDPYTMSSDYVDMAIQGFGAGLFNEKLIKDKHTRCVLLTTLTELYKIKGTPKSILTGLNFIGFRNLTLREWWLRRDPLNKDELQMIGKSVNKGQYWDSYYNQYKDVDPYAATPEILSWDNFTKQLEVIGDPHWFYTKDEVLELDKSHDRFIGLPSITPYFSIVFNTDVNKVNHILSVLERIFTVEFNNFLYGREFNYSTTIEGNSNVYSIVELMLALQYAEIRAEDKQKTDDLVAFLKTKFIEAPVFEYPYSYEQLILWCSDETNIPTNVLKSFTPNVYPYFDCGRELRIWWNSDESRIGTQIPDIYFDIFLYNKKDLGDSNDEIYHYNGTSYQEGTTTLDIDRILNEYRTSLYRTPFTRFQKPTHYTSTAPLQDVDLDSQPENMDQLQNDYGDITYHKVYQDSELIYDTSLHDGSQLLPNSEGTKLSWAVDNNYYYICSNDNVWWRTSIESYWLEEIPLPRYPDLNESFFYDDYVYKYVAINKWVRYVGTFNIAPYPEATFTVGDIVFDYPNISMQECVKPEEDYSTTFFESVWDSSEVREPIYSYPYLDKDIILDLSNRYDAERLLRGTGRVLRIQDLDSLTGEDGDLVLVTGQGDKPPMIYRYTRVSGTNDYKWMLSDKSISEVNLGMNNGLINWVDDKAEIYTLSDESLGGYRKVATNLLDELSAAINTYFRTNDIDFAGYFYKFRNSDELLRVVDFLKPKRARLLYYAISLTIDDRLFNTAQTQDTIERTKILQGIDSFVPKHDLIYVHRETGLYNREYHKDSPSTEYQEGIFNHWNERHPRDPNLKATVLPENNIHSSKKEWQIGFCKYDPRVIFPSGKLGLPENTIGGRLEDVDLYGIAGRQGTLLDYNPELTDIESDMYIKGDARNYLYPDYIPSFAMSTPSEIVVENGVIIERPVYHRPVFIAVQEIVPECYPAKPAGCCDYYDTGCIHDGEDNPHQSRWDGEKWVSIEKDIVQLDPGAINNGDTFCHACGPGKFTIDPDVMDLPEDFLNSHVYHKTLNARGFDGIYSWINGIWYAMEINGTFVSENEEQYKCGYVKSIDGSSSGNSSEYDPKIILIYNKDMRHHYWEIFDENNQLVIRTKIKDEYHTQDMTKEYMKRTRGTVLVEKTNFLNGNDQDVCHDTWTLQDSVTEIQGTVSNLKWVRFEVESEWDEDVDTIPAHSKGEKDQLYFDGNHMYQCVDSNIWVRTLVETDWASSYILPNSPENAFNCEYRNGYYYIYLDIEEGNYAKQWVRISCEESWNAIFTTVAPDESMQTNSTIMDPTEIESLNSTKYQIEASSFIYKSVLDTSDYSEHFCGNAIPIQETFRGMWEQYKQPGDVWCTSHKVWDTLRIVGDRITFKDAPRLFSNWKYNTWEAFEPGFEQESSWSEISSVGTSWEDIDEPRYDAFRPISEDAWNGIRSNVFETWEYWYNFLTNLFPMYNWPPYQPDQSDFDTSDADYWYTYDDMRVKGIVQHAHDSIKEANLSSSTSGELSSSTEGDETPILDDAEIMVIDYGTDLIDQSRWHIAPMVGRVTEDNFDEVDENGEPIILEDGNI